MMNDLSPSFDSLRKQAHDYSRNNRCYSAVVEITTYMAASARVTVMSSKNPIKSFSRGGQFVGVMAQFHCGAPYSDSRASAPACQLTKSTDPDKLPF
jgi:hypothetical protein